MNELKRAGTSEATNAGAPPLVSRLRFTSRNVPGEKIEPEAWLTPAVARTRASIASVIGVVSEPLLFPSTCVGVITTSWPRLAVWKMPAKDWLIVSVST